MPRFGLPQFTAKCIAVPEHSTISVGGAVAQPYTLKLADLAGLPRCDQVSDAQPARGALSGYVVVGGLDGMRAGLPLVDALADDALLADTMEGAPLSVQHGAPLRLVAPAHHDYKNIKHVCAIEFVGGDFNRDSLVSHSMPAEASLTKSAAAGAPAGCCAMSTV